MSAIKRTPADGWFSKTTRISTNWTCQRCGTQYDQSSTGLHASHYFGRANKRLRHEPDNVFAHCHGCHQYLSANPHEFTKWVFEYLGEARYEILLDKRNQLVKYNKQVDKEIAAHYKKEFERIEKMRMDGEQDEVEIVPYW